MSKSTVTSTMCVIAVLAFAYAKPSMAQEPQTAPKTVTRSRGFVTDPVKITAIFYNGKPIEPGIPFQGEEDWVKGVSVEVENISHKTLVEASLQIYFPSLGRPFVFHFAEVGQLTEHRRTRKDGSIDPDPRELIAIKPGQKFIIPFAIAFPHIQDIITARSNLAVVHICTVSPNQVFFIDGTMWGLQTFFKESQDGSNSYEKITPEEFYGADKGPIRD